jgi:hypothetical protein
VGSALKSCEALVEGAGAPHLEVDEGVLGIVHRWNVRVTPHRREDARDVHPVAVHAAVSGAQSFGEGRRAADDKYAVNLGRLRSASQLLHRVG